MVLAVNYWKMNGLGNDFVVLDGRGAPLPITPHHVRAIANRNTGIGCDQIIILSDARVTDLFMHIWNADGTGASACGNATRCVARLIMQEKDKDDASIETSAGQLFATNVGQDVRVDMGLPHFDWASIPLAENQDTLHVNHATLPLGDGVAVNVGNPHIVFFVDNVETVSLENLGPQIETSPLFPKRVNVNIAQVLSPGRIRLRVWERGTGITKACGTGAMASAVAGIRRGLLTSPVTVSLDGGDLQIEWQDGEHVFMTGPTEIDPQAALNLDDFAQEERS